MKNYLSVFIACVMLAFFSCQTKQESVPIDKAVVEKEVTAVLDTLYSFFDTHDIGPYASVLAENGLFLGTDGKEFWDKETAVQVHQEMFKDPSFKFTYTLTKRVIRVAEDGKSALSIDQIENTTVFGPDVPIRYTSHLVKTGNSWKIDFWEIGLIPDNEDLSKITAALAE